MLTNWDYGNGEHALSIARRLLRYASRRVDQKHAAPAKTIFSQLQDWSQRAESRIKYYSGKATYSNTFDWQQIAPDGIFYIALGQVYNMASLRLNGSELGTVWCSPWRLRIGEGVLWEESNKLEIVVANLWVNRLIGDSGLAEEDRLTWLMEKPFHPDMPLEPSGLLGPVAIEGI